MPGALKAVAEASGLASPDTSASGLEKAGNGERKIEITAARAAAAGKSALFIASPFSSFFFL
jgi:hypothetical protein